MYKKVIIFGLVLLLCGIAALGWVKAEQKKENLSLQKKIELRSAQLMKLKPLKKGQTETYYLAKALLEDGLEQELAKRQEQNETKKLMFFASVSLMAVGGTLSTCSLIIKIAKLLIAGCSGFKNIFLRIYRSRKHKTNKQKSKTNAAKNKNTLRSEQEPYKHQSSSKNHSTVHEESSCDNYIEKEAEAISKLYCNEKSFESQNTLDTSKISVKDTGADTRPFDQLAKDIRKTILSDYHENTLKIENSIRDHTENLKKQITQSVKEATLEHSNPLNATIEELACEISAIREYASLQKEKNENFQELHDWKVIKTFCLRTIRVIDNIQKRIQLLSQKNVETSDLEEISDELIFALESSSVERFEPAINSEYRGQEKMAEAIKDKDCSANSNMKGKIAKVVRAGYQYAINDGDIKIIRPAQVKLYG